MILTQRAREIGLDEAEYTELLKLFTETSRSELNAIRAAIASGDVHMALCAAHSIKGASANLGMPDISEQARTIEERSREGRLDGIGDAVRELEGLLAAVERSLKE